MKLIIFILCFCTINLYSQKEIYMINDNGVFTVPCKVNGLDANFIFDTGATNVSISMGLADLLKKNGLLDKNDIKGTVKYQIANGEIKEGTQIILRKINIDGLTIKNIDATIIHEQNAPLLLGQSAISKFGKVHIEGNKLIIFPKIDPNKYLFANIDLTKGFKDFGYTEGSLSYPYTSVKLSYLNNNNEHFLQKFQFQDQIVVFTEKGGIKYIVFSKKFNSGSELLLIFNNLVETISNNYGIFDFKNEQIAEWKSDYYDISIEIGIANTIILLYDNLNLGEDFIALDAENERKKIKENYKNYFQNLYTLEEDYEITKKSAEIGNAGAQNDLGIMYGNGEGVKMDKKLAYYWIKKSAEQGYAVAQYNLSAIYFLGEGVLTDKNLAIQWLEKSAESGFIDAQNKLGVLYSKGDGVLKNIKKSFYWHNKAAILGDPVGQFFTGFCYYYGQGVGKNSEKSFYWLKKSAEQGNAGSQYFIGGMYYFGYGIKSDKKESAYWIKKSYENGNQEAKSFWQKNQLWQYL
ncbi:MAG: SEL1-like repeat protein [Flavobacteriaceae bacterium]|nr:SEL1-like repeat protein [Flavobacteriaceae bacterium]